MTLEKYVNNDEKIIYDIAKLCDVTKSKVQDWLDNKSLPTKFQAVMIKTYTLDIVKPSEFGY